MLFNRAGQIQTANRQVSKPAVFYSPNRGWIRNEALGRAKAGGAEVLDNWFPTAEGCRMRKGSSKHATIADAVTHIASYEFGATQKLFATDEENIYDVTTPADPDVAPSADVGSQTSGDWSSVNFTTSNSSSFLVMVNGADSMQQYTGSAWRTVTAVSSPAITGVTTASLSHTWKYGNRLWFIGPGMSAWYLGTLAVTGAATELPLGGVFSLGGDLMFGASWSADAGDGLDDYCIFATTKGEVAVYQGDPASTFSKVGVYRIGKPLHKNAHFRVGGDIMVLTDEGIVSLGAAVTRDRTQLAASAITYPIEDAWKLVVGERNSGLLPFTAVLWPATSMLVVGIPSSGSQSKLAYVANARTGAWCRFTGWDIRCLHVFDDKLYFGTRDGFIVRGEVTGSDQGDPYSAVVVPKFEDFRSVEEKGALHARMLARANNAFTPQLFACANYEVSVPTPLAADPDENDNLWGTGVWGTSVWSSRTDTKARQSEWQSVAALGQALAPGLQVTSGRTAAPDVELIALHLMYEVGEAIGI